MQITLDTERMDARQAASVITLMMALWPDAAGEMTNTMYALKGERPALPDVTQAPAGFDPASLAAPGYEHADPQGDLSAMRLTLVPTAADAFAPPAAEPPEPTAAEAFPTAPGAAAPGTSTATATLAPAPVPPAPSPTPAPSAPPPGVELDSNGLPWDGRIHSAGRAKTKDGAWRQKRDVPEETRAAVTAELRAALAAPGPFAGSATAAPSAPATTPASSSGTSAPGQTAQTSASPSEGAPPIPPAPAPPVAAPPPPSAPAAPAPAAAPAPSAPPPTAPPAPAAPATSAPASAAQEFARVMRKVTEATTAGRATHDGHTAPALAAAGLTQMRDLLTRSDLLPTFEQTFDALVDAGAA